MKSEVFFLFAILALTSAQIDIDIVPTKEQAEQQEICEICQYVIKYFKNELLDPDFRQMIIEFVEEACVPLPIPLREICDYFVDHTVTKYMDKLLEKSELEICQELKVCEVIY